MPSKSATPLCKRCHRNPVRHPTARVCATCYGTCRVCGGKTTGWSGTSVLRTLCGTCESERYRGRSPACRGCGGPRDKPRTFYCSACAAEARRQSRRVIKASQKARRAQNNEPARKEYERLLDLQGGRCLICQTDKCPPGERFRFDVSPRVGQPHALLCGHCKQALFRLSWEPERLGRLRQYLEGRSAPIEWPITGQPRGTPARGSRHDPCQRSKRW